MSGQSAKVYESDLVAHIQQGAHCQPEGEALVVAYKVAHIFQKEVAWPVQVTVAQVGHHLHQKAELEHKAAGAESLFVCCMKA